MGKGMSTINTTLYASESKSGTYEKVCPIKSYPDMGGAPEMLQTTDLEDDMHTYTPGVQDLGGGLEFTANFNAADYAKIKGMKGKDLFFQLRMGKDGADGVFDWEGEIDVWMAGGEVNAVRDMTVISTPSTVIGFTAGSGSGSGSTNP